MIGLLYVLAALSGVQIAFLYVIYTRFTLQSELAVRVVRALCERTSPKIAETE